MQGMLSSKGKSSKDTAVSELMSNKVFYVRPEQILDGENLIGIVSIGDVVKQQMDDKEFTIKQLENCITGSY